MNQTPKYSCHNCKYGIKTSLSEPCKSCKHSKAKGKIQLKKPTNWEEKKC